MSDSIIIYNQKTQKLLNRSSQEISSSDIDLSSIGLGTKVSLGKLIQADTFALVFDGTTWIHQTYMQWEDLRINEALQSVKGNFNDRTQKILTHFVAGMDVKYQGKMSWVELLDELGKKIEE